MKLAHHLRQFWRRAAARGAKRIPGAALAVWSIKKFLAWSEYGGRESVTIHDGIRIYLRNDPNCEIRLGYLPYLQNGTFEPLSVEQFRRILRPGAVAVDVGAAFGYFSLLAAHLVGPSGRVFSFEPEAIGHANLVKNVELNGFESIIRPMKLALSDRRQTASYFGGPVGGSIMSGYQKQFNAVQVETVQAVTLDEIMEKEGWPTISLIKVDVEGGEINAFRGMRETLRRNPDVVILSEVAPLMLDTNGQTVEDFFGELAISGFTRFSDITHTVPSPLELSRDISRIKRMEIGHRMLGIVEIMATR